MPWIGASRPPTGFTGYIETLRAGPVIGPKAIADHPVPMQPVYRAGADRAQIGRSLGKPTLGAATACRSPSTTRASRPRATPVSKGQGAFDGVRTRPTKRRDEPDTAPEVEAEEPEA